MPEAYAADFYVIFLRKLRAFARENLVLVREMIAELSENLSNHFAVISVFLHPRKLVFMTVNMILLGRLTYKFIKLF